MNSVSPVPRWPPFAFAWAKPRPKKCLFVRIIGNGLLMFAGSLRETKENFQLCSWLEAGNAVVRMWRSRDSWGRFLPHALERGKLYEQRSLYKILRKFHEIRGTLSVGPHTHMEVPLVMKTTIWRRFVCASGRCILRRARDLQGQKRFGGLAYLLQNEKRESCVKYVCAVC